MCFSSNYRTADRERFPSRAHYRTEWRGTYTGMMYQCVELARRWLVMNKNVTFDDVGVAWQIFDMPFAISLAKVKANDAKAIGLPFLAFENGSNTRPQVGPAVTACGKQWSMINNPNKPIINLTVL